jgi:hypothetical protein
VTLIEEAGVVMDFYQPEKNECPIARDRSSLPYMLRKYDLKQGEFCLIPERKANKPKADTVKE